MSMAGGAFLLLALLLTVGGGLLLYWLVRAETDNRPEMDRETAERVARRDAPDDPDDR